MKLTVAEVARITGGSPRLGDGASAATMTAGVCTDSRLVQPGNLFVAIPGEQVDGHDFLEAAFGAGAAAALVSRPGLRARGALVEVADARTALQQLAGHARAVVNPVTVGITGSTGKTSTKDLLAAVAAVRFRTVAAERSLNNELGVPLTVLRIEPDTEVLVCELGARGPGQIAQLCSFVRPQVGVVTNVGVTHYELFTSAEAILAAKSELPAALPRDGVAVLNADDPRVAGMAAGTQAEVLTYGTGPSAWLRADSIELDRLGRPRFRLVRDGGRITVQLAMGGRHQVSNALAAGAAGLAIGLSLEEVGAGLEAATGSPWRMEITEHHGVVVINDAYNANPTSMASALDTAAAMVPPGGRLLAVLGHMAELGAVEVAEHERTGAQAAGLGARLLVVGERAAPMAAGARRAGAQSVVELGGSPEPEAVLAALGPLVPGDVVLIKGSRVAGLERVAALLNRPGTLQERTAAESLP